jgi:hypothetical protein
VTPKTPAEQAPHARNSAEDVIARQMKVDVVKIKEAPLPACVRMPGEAR